MRALLSTILDAAKPRNPYDTARAIESYLRDPRNFTYDTSVLDVDCGGRGIADCFAVSRRGYCEHFATTMVVMLRLQGIPARLVEGYLPGEPGAAPGEQVIRKSAAHAWVEAWFPGFGWVDFDPTGGVGQPQRSPRDRPWPPRLRAQRRDRRVAATDVPQRHRRAGRPDRLRVDAADAGHRPDHRASRPARRRHLALVAVWVRRRLGRPVQPEIVYRSVVAMAGRLGHPRRPTQTVYEYLGTLGDAVPSARPELQLVARSTVETAYGRRRLSPDRLAALGAAQRRLRLALLRLLVRRGGSR